MRTRVRQRVLAGISATFTMDFLSFLSARAGLTAPLAPRVIGRWFVSVIRGQPFHSDIAHSVAARHELAVSLAGHYSIGLALACIYLWGTKRLEMPTRHLLLALGYGMSTSALAWLLMFPAMGYGFFGAHGPPGTRLFISSLCNHGFYGLGLWIAVRAWVPLRGLQDNAVPFRPIEGVG